MARDWIIVHPEYEDILSDLDRALAANYSQEQVHNPFLHLSMHLSINEQVSIDQPRGIRQACQALAQRKGSEHEAHHEIMECLGEMIWSAQRNGQAPDSAAYLDNIRRR